MRMSRELVRYDCARSFADGPTAHLPLAGLVPRKPIGGFRRKVTVFVGCDLGEIRLCGPLQTTPGSRRA